VEKVHIEQKPAQVEQYNRWDTRGRVIEGDFVAVMYGDLVGQEVFLKEVTGASHLVVEETRNSPLELEVIIEGQHTDAPVLAVSSFIAINFCTHAHFQSDV
jgi:hypothetical protein